MQNLAVFESKGRTIIFEPDKDAVDIQFTIAKKWCNSIALETGHFSEYIFNKQLVRKPTQEEIDYYTILKERSKYAFDIES